MERYEKIDKIIVVEGRDDTDAVRKSVNAETIETHGYGIRKETWDMLQRAYETRGLIIFTDPDPAGERIRKTLASRFPKAMHAFIDSGDATKDGDVGIENADPGTIRKALLKAQAIVEDGEDGGHGKDRFSMRDMDLWGLNGDTGASERRRALGKKLGIGYCGAKTFLRRLNGFGISRQEIENSLDELA